MRIAKLSSTEYIISHAPNARTAFVFAKNTYPTKDFGDTAVKGLGDNYFVTDRIAVKREALNLAAPVMVKVLENLCFVAETVAHLRGAEREILPTTDFVRELLATIDSGDLAETERIVRKARRAGFVE